MNIMRKLRACGVAAVAALGLGTTVLAQEFPSGPITIVVGYPAGGVNDLLARTIAQGMSESFGQPVLVENRPGATGAIGLQYVLGNPPNGYTIGLSAQSLLAIKPALSDDPVAELGFDPIDGHTPIGLITEDVFIVVVASELGITTFDELVEYARENPGALAYGTNGFGGTSHLIGEILQESLGLDLVHVPYTGDADLTVALLSGEVQLAFPLAATGFSTLLPSGQVEALATTGTTRAPAFPDLPTLSEFPGLENVHTSFWVGMFGPAGIPREIVDVLNAEMNAAMARPEAVTAFQNAAMAATPMDPDAFAAFITEAQETWDANIRNLGITIE